MSTSAHVIDVDAATFEADVIARSHEVPVVVDFWAEWCGPCRTLGPILEAAVDAMGGDVVLAKVDTDANPQLSQAFRVQGIPAVKAFRDGAVVAEFTGAQPPAAVEAFLQGIVPSQADLLVSRARGLQTSDPAGAVVACEEALALDEGHAPAALLLAELVVAEDPQRALELVQPLRPLPAAEVVATRAALAQSGGDVDALAERVEQDPADAAARIDLARLLAAEGDHARALDLLLAAVEVGDEHRDPARDQLVSLFAVLGDDSDLVRAARPRLARALF